MYLLIGQFSTIPLCQIPLSMSSSSYSSVASELLMDTISQSIEANFLHSCCMLWTLPCLHICRMLTWTMLAPVAARYLPEHRGLP